MRCYLASRFSRREEMIGCAERLLALGIEAVSTWHFRDPSHGQDDGSTPQEIQARVMEDIADVLAADVLILFTEEQHTPTRGGRFVEFGLALGAGKRILVVGPRENVFMYLSCIETMDSFDVALQYLSALVGSSTGLQEWEDGVRIAALPA